MKKMEWCKQIKIISTEFGKFYRIIDQVEYMLNPSPEIMIQEFTKGEV